MPAPGSFAVHTAVGWVGSAVRWASRQLEADGVSHENADVTIVALAFSVCIVVVLFCSFRWRRPRWPPPMPWDVYRTVALGQLRMVYPQRHELDSEMLEVTTLKPADFECVRSGDHTLLVKELLEFLVQHPFMGYKGGVARLVGKLAWLQRGNPTLEAEIEGFNDIDLIYFLRDDEENKKASMKALVDGGLSIGGIPVEAPDVEYTFDTFATVIATRDLTQNQCIVVSDDKGRVFLINSKVCREHSISGTNATVSAPDNCSLDDDGQVISAGRIVARALISQIRGRATQFEIDQATRTHYQSKKLSKTAQFQVFSKTKNNEQYMQAYTQLVQWGFLDRQQYPHVLWGECYAHVNSTLSKHGYRLEPNGELDSAAVEIWKEAKYAEQHARSRVNIFRDFRWHRAVLDTSYTMDYKIQDSDETHSLFLHAIREGGNTSHISRDHLRHGVNHGLRAVRVGSDGHLRNRDGMRAQVVPGGTFSDTIDLGSDSQQRVRLGQLASDVSSARTKDVISLIRTRGSLQVEEEAALQDDSNEPLLRQTLFGKLTVTKTVSHVIRLTRPAWREFGIALLLSCTAAVFYILVIKRELSVYFLLAAGLFSVASCVQFNLALNKALLHAFRSMFLALINMRLDAFTDRLFPEFWARLTGDSRALAAILKSINDIFVEAMMIVGAGLALLWQVPGGCFTPGISDAFSTILACVALMFVTSLVSSLALRLRSQMVRSLVGFTYFQSFSALTKIFEVKAMPEEACAAIAAYSETQEANLIERRNMAVLEEVSCLFLQYVELACLAVVLPVFIDGIKSDPGCSGSYAAQSVAVSVGFSAVRRLCVSLTSAVAGIGSLERFFLLGQTALRAVATRFDGIGTIGSDGSRAVMLSVPSAFTFAVGGSPEFGPFAQVPALPSAATLGRLNVMAMPRGSGATSFGKVLLRMHPAPAKVLLNGLHIEQYEALMLTWVVHVIDHAPFPSNIAKYAGQGRSLADFVQLGLGNEAGEPLDLCLERAGIRRKAMNIPFGVESTTWSTVMTEPERFQVQLAQALYRASLGAIRVLVAIDPLRGCPAGDVERLREVWLRALTPLCNSVLILVIEQSGDAGAWLKK